jgi:hypothetical protein
VNAFASFGAIDALFDVRDPHEPSVSEVATVRAAIAQARALQLGLRAPVERLKRRAAASTRSVALDIRKRITEAW